MYPLVSFRHEAVDLVRSYKMPLTASYPLVPPNIQQLSCKNSCRPSPGDQPQHGTKWSNRRSSLVNARSPERDTRKLTAPAPRAVIFWSGPDVRLSPCSNGEHSEIRRVGAAQTRRSCVMKNMVISLALGAGAIVASSAADAAPLTKGLAMLPDNSIENVRLVCDQYGQCRTRGGRRAIVQGGYGGGYAPGYYGGPSYYGGGYGPRYQGGAYGPTVGVRIAPAGGRGG